MTPAMNPRVALLKQLRGNILQWLSGQYPGAFNEQNLTHFVMESGGSAADVPGLLQYLQDKQYIEVKSAGEEIGLPMKLVRILPAGIDLLEGTTQDPGVILP